MMIIGPVILTLLAYFAGGFIKKHFNIIMVLTIILSAISMFSYNVLSEGELGLAFFIVVMYAGAFSRRSKISRKLKAVRQEYSILGFIFLVPHFVVYLLEFITGGYEWEFFGVLGMIVMIPLFITSFTSIRREYKYSEWKKLQRWSYLAYLLIYIHLVLVASGGEAVMYSVIFGVYTLLRVYQYIKDKPSRFKLSKLQLTAMVITVTLAVPFGLVVYGQDDVSLEIGSVSLSSSSHEGIDISTLDIADGWYSGEADGFKNLDVVLDVYVENGVIVEIDLIENGSTRPEKGVDFEAAAYQMVENIIEAQSTDLDSIAGATKTADGVLEAVEDALTN